MVEVIFDPAAVSVDAVQRAAYRLSDRLAIDLAIGDSITCTVYPLDEIEDGQVIASELRIEVLDQVLRERIRTETEEARNLILALAFSNTGLVSGD